MATTVQFKTTVSLSLAVGDDCLIESSGGYAVVTATPAYQKSDVWRIGPSKWKRRFGPYPCRTVIDIANNDAAISYSHTVDTVGGAPTGSQIVAALDAELGSADWRTNNGGAIDLDDPEITGTITGTYTLGGEPTFPASVVTLTGTQTLSNKTLTSVVLGTPASGILSNCTSIPAGQISGVIPIANLATGTPDGSKFIRDDGTLQSIPGGGDALVANPLSQFAATTSAQLAGVVSDETGSGALVFATSPTLVTPILGTPTSGTLTNCTIPVGGVTGLGTGVGTFLATPSSANLASAVTGETGSGALVFGTSPTLVTPDIGTPSAATLTNATGLPIATGVSGLGTGVAAFLATPSSANLASAVTGETGSGALVFGTAPTISALTASGITTYDGATVTTANALGALSIDVTRGLNTKSISADSTFTFSGTPATANTWFQLSVTNTDTAPHTITFPSAFSLVTQSARTTCPIPASGRLNMVFRYNGSTYEVYGDGQYLNNTAGTTAPGVGDDIADGYGPGSLWFDGTGNAAYWCESNGAGAAVWNPMGGGSGDMVLASAQTITGAKSFNDGTLLIKGSTSGTATLKAQAIAGTSTFTLPSLGVTLGYLSMPQNSRSANYTLAWVDQGAYVLHPSADTSARTFTIPANASESFPLGTTLTIINQNGAGTITIAITSDTMRLAGAGTTGSRTLAANGIAFAVKITSTEWIIHGVGLT